VRRFVIVGLLVLVACGPSVEDELQSFRRQLEAGVQCFGLFDLRNDFERRHSEDEAARQAIVPTIERMNAMLREIGCYSSTSERTDQ
jgi:Tfp pilus assembly protein PilP